jgi:radical SAM superfamily enzyme YgiQ (UPF0313 family)
VSLDDRPVPRSLPAKSAMKVVLISTYELGHQPFGLASPAAWLRELGASVAQVDLAVQPLPQDSIVTADLVAFYVPMHTATRIAVKAIGRVKAINPDAHLCFYGLYAPVNEGYLRKLGVKTILGGEFEGALAALVNRISTNGACSEDCVQPEPAISTARLSFRVPDRSGLPSLSKYAYLNLPPGERRTAGYTEASRGCKHLCRHCPIVPVYQGRFRIVQKEVVLEDIRRQVEAGARHITFGDPDFFNGPGHAVAIVRDLHRDFPDLTYDVTIKIEHLLKQAHLLTVLRATGCLVVTSAVESFDNRVLEILDKRHTREDFERVVSLFRKTGLALNPTFVSFNPWTSLKGYREFLAAIIRLDLVENVSPIQYAIRLLIPAGSKLLELAEVRQLVERFDEAALCYTWSHPDPRTDRLYEDVLAVVKAAKKKTRSEIFGEVWRVAHHGFENRAQERFNVLRSSDVPARATIPYLSEPWFC